MSYKLPAKIQEMSGQGTLLDGYIRFADGKLLAPLLEAGYSHCKGALPFAITALGEILTWEQDKYICRLSFPEDRSDVLASGAQFFFDDLRDQEYAEKCFRIGLYRDAVRELGQLDEDECFGFVPLPALGGPMDLAHLQKVKYKEYLHIAIQSCGPVE